MKKLRKTIAVLLCLCMLVGTGVVGASAYTEEELEELRIKQQIFTRIEDLYSIAEQKFPEMGREGDPIYTGDTLGELNVQLEIVWRYKYPEPGDILWQYCSIEELQSVYDNLKAAYDGLKVKTSALQELYDFVKGEANGTGEYISPWYYEERIWREFCAARQMAADVLADPDDDSVTGAYFALRAAYNKLCASHQVTGDIDGNGSVELADVLYLQKYLAKMVPMNCSQLIAADFVSGNKAGTITTENVIMMQKYIAGMDIFFDSRGLGSLNQRDYNPLIDDGKLI